MWLCAALAALSLTGFVAYEVAENPGNQLFGSTVVSGPADRKVVALTYDDGPNPPYTTAILDVLKSEHVHATFFVVGRAVQAYPAVVRREAALGHLVGNHSWSHEHLIVETPAHLRGSLERTDAAIERASGQRVRFMRPPFGARDWLVLDVTRKLGLVPVMWSVPLAKDWEYPNAATIAARIVPNVRDGSIIVLHDGNRGLLCGRDRLSAHICDRKADVQATRLIVRALKARGFRFVTIAQLVDLGRSTRTSGRPQGE